MYHIFLIHAFGNGHLGCLHILVIVNSAVMNIEVHVSFWFIVFFGEVKWALGIITVNKTSEDNGIPAELYQILRDDAVKVLPSICQKILKTQQWPQDWKRSVFIPIPKKDNPKECSNYCTIALISHTSKEMLKVFQARLQTGHERRTYRCSSWI